jgi:hypothetical protein
MKKHFTNRAFIAAAVIAIVLQMLSCEKEECTQSLENDAGFGLYTFADTLERDTTLYPLSVYGEGHADSLLGDSAQTNALRLPLNPNKDFTKFIFKVGSQKDTLHINYIRELNFISHECGFITDYHIEKARVSAHIFDSVVVTQKTVTRNEDEEHFKIYLSPPDTLAQ